MGSGIDTKDTPGLPEQQAAGAAGYSIGWGATPTPTLSPTTTSSPVPGATPTATPDYRRIEMGAQIFSYSGSGYNKTFDYTVEEGEDRVLVFAVSFGAHSGQSPHTPRYDDVPMTFIRSCWATGDLGSVTYYLPDPPVGTHDLAYGFTTSAEHVSGAFTLYHVDLEDPIGETVCQVGSGGQSASLSSQPGDLGFNHLQQQERRAVSEGEGQTRLWNYKTLKSSWEMRTSTSSKPATGTSITMSYSSDENHPTRPGAAYAPCGRPSGSASASGVGTSDVHRRSSGINGHGALGNIFI